MITSTTEQIENTRYLSPDDYKALAKNRKLSQAAISRFIGCHYSHVCYFFQGNRNLNETKMHNLHNLLTSPLENFQVVKNTKPKQNFCLCDKCGQRIKEIDKEHKGLSMTISPMATGDEKYNMVICKRCVAKFVKKMVNIPDWIK